MQLNQLSSITLKKYALAFSMSNYKSADNGTRTRTNRAEVCYATPTTSYPHFRVYDDNAILYENKIQNQEIFILFYHFLNKMVVFNHNSLLDA